MLFRAHSRQKMSPWEQATGSMAGSRQSQHEAKGRKDSRVRRADDEDQADLAMALSCEVKTARLVFLLPALLDYLFVGEGGGCYYLL